jgi:hypothetical protein
MIFRLFAIGAAFGLLTSSSPMAEAQFGNSGFGGIGFGSGFGSSGMGSSGFGSSGFGSSGFGSSGFGSSGFGSSGFGSSGFGNSGFGASRFGSGGFGSSGFGSSRFGSSGMGSSGYGGGQYGGGQNFVGRDAADMQQVFGQMGRAGQQFFNQMNRNMGGRNNNNRRRITQKIQNPPQPTRVEVRVGFTPPRQAPSELANTIRTRIAKILVDHKMSPPVLNMDGDTAVISGVAASENERDVIAMLIALEPGVRDVRNEMTLADSANVDTAPVPGS